MINKSLSLLLIAFVITSNFCLAQDNFENKSENVASTTQVGNTELNNCDISLPISSLLPIINDRNFPLNPVENAVVSLNLTRVGHEVTLSGSGEGIFLKKGGSLTINVNGNAVSRYQLIYGEPINCPVAVTPIPSIYYTLENPCSEAGWYNWAFWISVLREEQNLNTISSNSISFHFTASDAGTKKVTINIFDDTGRTWSDNIQTYSYDTVASFTFIVKVQ